MPLYDGPSSTALPRLTAELHDDTPLDRFDFGFAVYSALFCASEQYLAVLRAQSEMAGAVAEAERALSRQLDRELVTTLLQDVLPLVDRRAVFAEAKANVSASHDIDSDTAPAWLTDFFQRVDTSLAPLWQALSDAESEPGSSTSSAAALIAQLFAADRSSDREWHFVRSAGPRLHLQSKTSPHRVWLEREGRRTFEPEAPLDLEVFGPLELCVSRPEVREQIEQTWASRMVREGWLAIEWESERSLALCAYPERPGAFRRHIVLGAGVAGEPLACEARPLCPQDVRLSQAGELELWAEHRVPLPRLLWGQRDTARGVDVPRCAIDELTYRVVCCSGTSCEHPGCSAKATASNEPRWEAPERTHFKQALECVLKKSLTDYYRALLVRANDLHLPSSDGDDADPERPMAKLPETELAQLVAKPDDSRDCRRAYAEVVVALLGEEAALRHSVEMQLLDTLRLEELPGSLDITDTLRFWRNVDDVLEEEWVGHGFQAEERWKAEWRPGHAPGLCPGS